MKLFIRQLPFSGSQSSSPELDKSAGSAVLSKATASEPSQHLRLTAKALQQVTQESAASSSSTNAVPSGVARAAHHPTSTASASASVSVAGSSSLPAAPTVIAPHPSRTANSFVPHAAAAPATVPAVAPAPSSAQSAPAQQPQPHHQHPHHQQQQQQPPPESVTAPSVARTSRASSVTNEVPAPSSSSAGESEYASVEHLLSLKKERRRMEAIEFWNSKFNVSSPSGLLNSFSYHITLWHRPMRSTTRMPSCRRAARRARSSNTDPIRDVPLPL